MKKNLAISALVIASVLAFAGCAKNVEEPADVNAEESVVEATEASEAATEETAEAVENAEETENTEAVEAPATLEEYFAAHEDELAVLTQMSEANEGLDISVKENTIYYTYTLTGEITEETAASIVEAFSTEDTVNSTVSSVKMTEQGAGIEGVTFVYTYVDEEGNEIAHATFNNEGLVVEE